MSTKEFGGVDIKGLDELLNRLKYTDRNLERAFKKGLKEAVQPVLNRARSRAHAIADDGTYAASLAISSRSNGAVYVLKSGDKAAGVKEFAKPGAVALKGPRKGKRVGVPHRANKPRAMGPAVEESEQEVLDAIELRMQEVLDEVGNG